MIDAATQIALDSLVERYAADQVAKAQLNAEDAFLIGRFGQEFLGLQRYGESSKEALYRWTFPANVGNTDPTKQVPHGPHTWVLGDPATFSCQSASAGEDNFYAYMRLPVPTVLPRRLVDSRIFQIQDLSGWQALEFQTQFTMNGLILNCAWQANIVRKVWRYFDYLNSKWIEFPSVPFPDLTQAASLIAEFSLSPQNTTHVSLTVNGKLYPVAVSQKPTPRISAEKFTAAFQVDPKKGASCSLSILQTDLRML